jgi:glycosyltransferase involved in cell wall biosynthesis
MPVNASVVIPVRDAEATLPEQLAALSAQNFEGSWEVILVDDASTDRSYAIANEFRTAIPTLQVLRDGGHGSGAARNIGVRIAGSDKLLFCDADDVVSPSWIRELARALDHFDLVGGALEYHLLNEPRALASRNLILERGLTSVLGHLPYASSANMGIRRAAFDAIGGFDAELQAGGDADLCWRAQYAGFSIGFSSDSIVHYRFRQGTAGLMRQVYAYAKGNQRLYVKHHQLGTIEAPPSSRYKVTLYEMSRAFVRVPALLLNRRRRRYLGHVARGCGSMVGLIRHRVPLW